MNVRNKLECLPLESLSSLVECLRVRSDTLPKVEHLKVSSLEEAPASPAIISLDWKGLPRDKRSSLLQK